MKKKALALLATFLILANIVSAQSEENLKLHFDFSQVEGVNVTDAVGGIRANLVGAAKVEQLGKYSVLNLGDAAGYLIGLLLHLSPAKRRAVSIEVGMQNSGLASSLATLHFAAYPLATIPGALFSVWHNISGAIVARLYSRHGA